MTDDDSELSQDSVEEKKNLDIDIDVTEDPEINNTLKEETYDEIIKERDALKDRLIRSLADSENLRKRGERDRKDAEVYGGTKLARDLLSVHDNMSRALDAIDDELRVKAQALVEGIELTQRDLLAVFSRHKIDQIAPKVGEKFDPKFHQAMFEAALEGTEKGDIIQVMTNGFKIGERLLRAAQVGVSSNLIDLEEDESAVVDTERLETSDTENSDTA